MIGGVPAFRALGDTHACPLATPNPHGSGVVAMGSRSVLVGGLPLARLGDNVVEAGGANAIMAGCMTVLVG